MSPYDGNLSKEEIISYLTSLFSLETKEKVLKKERVIKPYQNVLALFPLLVVLGPRDCNKEK